MNCPSSVWPLLKKQMAELRDSFNSKKAQWENEKNAVEQGAEACGPRWSPAKAEIEKATPHW